MLHRSREKIRQLKVLINWKHTQATQSSLGQEVTTSYHPLHALAVVLTKVISAGINKSGDDAIRSIQSSLGNSGAGSQNTISRPLNDLLPPEILIQIFETLILDVRASYRITPILSRVCRSWHSVALELQLCKALITESKAMDTILEYIHTTNRYKEDETAGIRDLTVHTDYHLKDFHRLLELLDLCPVVATDKPEAGGKFYLPTLKALSLSRLKSTELAFLLTSVDPAKLRSLKLRYTPFPCEDEAHVDIFSLQFPHLQEITVQANWEEHDPGLADLCQLAPTLETLDVSIIREDLQKLINFLASDHAPNSLKVLKVRIEHAYMDDFRRESPIMKTLIDLIEKRGWKECIHVPYNSMHCLLE